MKRAVTSIFLISITTILISAWSGLGWADKQPQAVAAVSAPSGPILGVDEFMKSVEPRRGTVRLEGVVSAVAPAQQTLSLIDTKEFEACSVVTCARLTLPVRWTGPMPSLRDTVRLEGEVQQVSGKLIFQARTLEKVAPPQEAK